MIFRYLGILAALFLIFACILCSKTKNNQPEIQKSQSIDDFFNVNYSLQYSLYTHDSTNQHYDSLGYRTARDSSNLSIGGYHYQSIYQISHSQFNKDTFFQYLRFTEDTAYLKTDTNQFFSYLPDSLDIMNDPDLEIIFDPEIKFFTFPLSSSQYWPVFNIYAYYKSYPKISIFNITAFYEEKEILPFQNDSLECEKISYIAILNIPESMNPLKFKKQEFALTCWVAPDYGFVKLRGNPFILSLFGNRSMDIYETQKLFTETLINNNEK